MSSRYWGEAVTKALDGKTPF
jgi:hypothetical protein